MINSETPIQEPLYAAIRALVGWTDRNQEAVKKLDFLLSTLVDPKFSGAIIPALVSEPTPGMVYYAVAKTDFEWRSLRPLISAAVGITYSDFTGLTVDFEPSSDLEKVIASAGFTKISRFGAHGDRDRGRSLATSLVRLVEGAHKKPLTPSLVTTTTAQLVAEFDMSLEYRDRNRCDEILSELSDQMRLDAVNIWFLRARLHARFSEWNELVNASFFEDLAVIRRPQRITTDLVEAIYKSLLSEYERSDDAQGAVDFFSSKLITNTGDIFNHLPGNPSPDVVKCFVVAELSQLTPDVSEVDRLSSLSSNWLETDKKFLDSLMSLAPADAGEQQDDVLDTAPKAVEMAIFTAIIDPSEETRNHAVAMVEDMSDDDRSVLFSNSRISEFYKELISETEAIPTPNSWEEWIAIAPTLDFMDARRLADSAIERWPIAEKLATSADVNHLTQTLNNVPSDARISVDQALPFIVGWVKSDEDWPNLSYASLYRQLLLLLLFGGSTGPRSLVAIAELLTALLTLNTDEDAYIDAIGFLTEQVPDRVSGDEIDWLVDMIELTVSLPCRNENVRAQFLSAAVTRFNQLSSLATPGQFELLQSMLVPLDMNELLVEREVQTGTAQTESQPLSLSGLTIGIYTLTESVGTRAAKFLEDTFDGLSVVLNHDKSSTRQLSSLAEKADLFIICWNSAKHAATSSILDARRVKGIDTRYATGASSIIREVRNHFEYVRLRESA
jgi:hypothetical protein